MPATVPALPTTTPSALPDHVLAAVLTLAQRELAQTSEQKRLAFRSHD